ncbi:hypothetical protein SteCoe_2528 [Stentor coeruleus]|uniref:RING-type domain-containing protein n=1 Tax=Stentor coeruleus TaxID=5963 RepID=A0A1R2CZ91_9CILI|nr:hypothetical protein SteCoe_2528 [Stentor coeruleus]
MEGARSDNSSDEEIEIITTNKGLPVNKGLGMREPRINTQIRKVPVPKNDVKIEAGNQSRENKEFDVKIIDKSQITKSNPSIEMKKPQIKSKEELSKEQELAENNKETIEVKFEIKKTIQDTVLPETHPAIIPKIIGKTISGPALKPEPSKSDLITENIRQSHISTNDKKSSSSVIFKSGMLNPKNILIPATISPNIAIKRIPAEELSKVLSNIINHLIPLIDINKVFLNQSQILDEIDKIAFSNCEDAHQLLEQLKSYQCNNCQSESLKIQLSCKHSFCESCTNSFQIVPSIENTSQSTLLCPICTKPITENEFNLLFPQNNQRILAVENEFLLEKLNTQGFLKCRICNKNKSKFYNTCCYHMCRDCLAENIRLKKFNCSICNTSFTHIEDILYDMVLCDNCNVKGYYIGDYMKAIEGGKCTLCSLCLNKSLNQGMCQKCGKKVSKIEKLEISDFLFTKCEVCNEEVFRGHANFNTCCGSIICVSCLRGDGVCMKCGYREIDS